MNQQLQTTLKLPVQTVATSNLALMKLTAMGVESTDIEIINHQTRVSVEPPPKSHPLRLDAEPHGAIKSDGQLWIAPVKQAGQVLAHAVWRDQPQGDK